MSTRYMKMYSYHLVKWDDMQSVFFSSSYKEHFLGSNKAGNCHSIAQVPAIVSQFSLLQTITSKFLRNCITAFILESKYQSQ